MADQEDGKEGKVAEGKTIIQLAPILYLPPVDIEQLHPYALKRYLEFLEGVYKEVPALYLLTDEDLTDDERAKRKEYTDGIVEWLQRCNKDSGEAALMVYPYSTAVTYYMTSLKALLKAAYERRAEKQEQETRKRKRLEALQEIDPPREDAKKYLSGGEYQRFLNSLPGAADAFLDTEEERKVIPNVWLLNQRASDYLWLTGIIKERKEKEARQKQAQLEHEQYLDRLSATVKKFKGEFAKSKKPKFVYPPELEKYQPDSWCDLDSPSQQQIQNWAERKILERLPEILANLAKWELTWQVWVLPHATYEVASVPCLTWYFQSHILVTVNLELKKGVIRKQHPAGYTVEVQAEGEKLGTLYLGPVQWVTPGSFTTPIALLFLLAKGEMEEPGIKVINRGSPFTTFAVQGFEEETVELHDSFRKFIMDLAKGQPLAEALLAKGLIDKETAKLVETKWDEPLPVSGKLGDAGGSELENVVAKLVELGWTKADAKKAVETTTFPKNATTEEIVSIILEKSY